MSNPAELADRLERLTQHQDIHQTLETFKSMSIEEMHKQKITFGKAHHGKTYHEVWTTEKQWTKFMLKRYQQTTKVEHLMYFHYVELMVERQELETGLLSDEETELRYDIGNQSHSQQPKSKAAPKPKPRVRRPEIHELNEDEFAEEEATWTVTTNDEVTALQHRMGAIEEALTEVVQHLRGQNQ